MRIPSFGCTDTGRGRMVCRFVQGRRPVFATGVVRCLRLKCPARLPEPVRRGRLYRLDAQGGPTLVGLMGSPGPVRRGLPRPTPVFRRTFTWAAFRARGWLPLAALLSVV